MPVREKTTQNETADEELLKQITSGDVQTMLWSRKPPKEDRPPPPRSHSPLLPNYSVDLLWILPVLFSLICYCDAAGAVISTFEPNDPGLNPVRFTHLQIHRTNGQVYLGAVNRLYRLESDLELKETVQTGPVNDNPSCPVNSPCLLEKRPTSNENRVLVIYYDRNRLIACGNVSQGVCTSRDLGNITNILDNDGRNPPIVPTDPSSSVVAFIGPGVSPPGNKPSKALYVGRAVASSLDETTPLVSSRSLEAKSMFELSFIDPIFGTGTFATLDPKNRQFFKIKYVYGFSSGRFSYFVTVQPRALNMVEPTMTKIVRICHDDSYYYSYAEVGLICTNDKDTFNLAQAAYVGNPGTELEQDLGIRPTDDVLFVSFASSFGDPSQSKAGSGSAICMYSIPQIQQKFTENIRQCFLGNGMAGLDFIGQTYACQKSSVDINDDFCGMDFNYPFNATLPVVSSPILTYPDVRITSLATSVTHAYTVLFMGTEKGSLKKAVVEKKQFANEYDEIPVDPGSAVLPDMGLSPGAAEFVYVATARKVSRISVQDCSVYKSCGDCLGASDPYCGWCSLENKCSLRSNCKVVKDDNRFWISYKSSKCTKISSVTPNQIQRSTARTLALVVENLPSLQGQLTCKFSFSRVVLETNASRVPDGVQCATPRVDLLPELPDNEQSMPARLSVQNGVSEFSSTNVTFYDCAAFADCSFCTSSPFPCDWCVQGHRCTHDTGENCRNDYLVNGQNRSGYSSRSGPNFCPRIKPDVGFFNGTYASVPAGMMLEVKVRVENVQPFQSRFTCVFNIDGRIERTEGNLISEQVTCAPIKFDYLSFAPNASVDFEIIWSEDKPLDNPNNLFVLVYKCAAMSSNCGFCLDLPAEFECGWCQKTCEVVNQCSSNWLNRSSTCPGPEIVRFYPTSGPWEGGTMLSIEGINLGKTFADVTNGVQVVGRPCIPQEDRYERTAKIVCETDSYEQLSGDITASGDIAVNVAKQFTAISAGKFSYVDPKITGFTPQFGPIAGGTLVTIQGRYLNAGTAVSISFGSSTTQVTQQACTIVQRNATSITCITSATAAPDKVGLEIVIDRGRRVYDQGLFEYVSDPDITSVSSYGSSESFGNGLLNPGPRGTPSGGSMVIVEGSNLNVVAEPRMIIKYNGQEFFGTCESLSDVRMLCRSPVAKTLSVLFPPGKTVDRGVELEYGFKFDGVQSLANLSLLSRHFPKFQLYPDPVIYNFTDLNGMKYHRSEFLFIEGDNLNQAYRMEDYVVEIGMGKCEIYSLARKQLTCRPPETEPSARGLDGRERVGAVPEVRVIITGYQNVSIGALSYEPISAGFVFSTEVIVGISVGGAFLVLLVILFIVAYRRKATESTRVLKTMQEQIDVLELQVASECKEAFAELQTDITDWTGDLTTYGIPFRDYRWYIAKVLFPGNSDVHPLMTGEMSVDPTRKANIDNGLKLFGQLLLNKTFLLTFIRTLESNRYFGMKDRVNVASLLMAFLQSDMVYCTEVLKTLLSDLIEKCVDGKSNQNLKLLFRRNESVAEKMLSAWLTFLLYPFLKDVAGRPLYLLYRAVQMQIEKGPVDSITSEAKYSLSEEKLVREKIEYKKLIIYVSCVDPEHSSQDYQVKVLDCDSITQVKEKALDVIYRNTPFSRRPRPENLDLEWRTGQAGRCPLQDEDQTSIPESGGGGVVWRRFNTLRHYNVNDGAAFVLVPKHTNFYNLTIMSDKYESDKSYHSHKSSPALSRGVSPFVHADVEHGHGVKSWHLVKPHDSPDPPSRDGTQKRGNKMMTEIYLTRLLTTKTTLKKFIDEMFETILCTSHRNNAFPYAIKYLFDFLDDQALHHEITDPEVVHTWKSNSLPLRFWVNLIKNPNFIFDIHKSNSVDSCLSVIAQALMESCSTSDLKLSKDSPSSKLLFAKDIVIYQDWVKSYYDDIKYQVPEITDQDLHHLLDSESKLHRHEFHTRPALLELFTYAKKHLDPMMAALNADEFAERARLPSRLLQVVNLMNP